MGHRVSTDSRSTHDMELVPSDEDAPDTLRNRISRTPSNVVGELGKGLSLQIDLRNSIHQLALLGKAEGLRSKLRNGDVNELDGDQLSALHYAARYNHIKTIEVLLEHMADVNIRGQDERSPLHYAARCRTELRQDITDAQQPQEENKTGAMRPESAIKLLKRNNADVNGQDKYGQGPLHYAAMTGNYVAAKELIECGGNVQLEDSLKITPLVVAATHGHGSIVKLFLDSDADIHQADSSKQTAFHRAAKGGHLDVMQILITRAQHCKFLEDLMEGRDTKLMTPLYHAVSNGHIQITSLLLSKYADVNARMITMATPLHAAASVGSVDIIELILRYNAKVDAHDIYQRTPLMYAAIGNHVEAIKILRQRGADINLRDLNHSTALLLAAQSGHGNAMQILLKLKADLHVVDKLDRSVVFHCVEQGNILLLQVLFSHRKFPWSLLDQEDCYGQSPLHLCVIKGNKDALMLLLDKGAQLNKKDEEQNTLLHLAARRGYDWLVQVLLSKSCCMMNAENEDLNTSLHLACRYGHEKVVKLLVTAGANITATNASAATPLHLAALKGHTKCCQLLLLAGASINEFDKDSKTPLMLAVLGNHVEVTHLLLDHGASLAASSKKQMNALELAVDAGKRETALTIIQCAGWEAGMRHISEDEKGNRVTPFRRMIEKMPSAAAEVLNRCFRNNSEVGDEGSQVKTVLFEYLEDTYQSNVKGVDPFDATGHLRDNIRQYSTDVRRMKKNHPLMLMIKHKRPNLLSHPVCVSLINHKWTNYCRWVYYSSFALYVIFLLSYTTYLLSVRSTQWMVQNITWTHDHSENKICDEAYWDSWQMSTLNTICKFVVISLFVTHILKELYLIYQVRSSYLTPENLIEWICYISAFTFVIDYNDCPYKEEWQWHLGAISIFLVWMNFLLFIRVIPFLGIYVIMFTEVFITFSTFSILFLFFIIAFALSFYTVLGDRTSFRSPPLSILRTSVMMIGELNYEENFNNPDEQLEYPGVTYILLIAFLIFMSILIMNLLVGLAVDDIKAVQAHANLQKLAMQTKIVLNIEMMFPDFLRRKHILKEIKVTSGYHRGILGFLIDKLSPNQKKEVSDVEEIRRDIHQLKQSVSKLIEATSCLNDDTVLKSFQNNSSIDDLNQLTESLASFMRRHHHISPTVGTGLYP